MDSSSTVGDSIVNSDSGQSGSGVISIIGTSKPVGLSTTAYQHDQQQQQQQVLPQLPSHPYRYTVWHELSQTAIKGHQLKAPRIRDGPAEKEQMFYHVRDSNERRIHHNRKGRERKDYRDSTEEWEQTVCCNLCYQDLGHGYQKNNFLRVLRRLVSVEELHLVENTLLDLSSCSFPRCVVLNLGGNYIYSFKKLPKVSKIKILNLEGNDIGDLNGIEALRKTPIESLTLKGNPISYSINYRYNVFQRLPILKTLDNIQRLPSDGEQTDGDTQPTNCVLS